MTSQGISDMRRFTEADRDGLSWWPPAIGERLPCAWKKAGDYRTPVQRVVTASGVVQWDEAGAGSLPTASFILFFAWDTAAVRCGRAGSKVSAKRRHLQTPGARTERSPKSRAFLFENSDRIPKATATQRCCLPLSNGRLSHDAPSKADACSVPTSLIPARLLRLSSRKTLFKCTDYYKSTRPFRVLPDPFSRGWVGARRKPPRCDSQALTMDLAGMGRHDRARTAGFDGNANAYLGWTAP